MSVTNIGITAPFNPATVSPGAKIAGDGAFETEDQRTVNENFGSAVDGAVWADKTSGSGRVDNDLALERALLFSPASADAAMRVRKSSFDFTTEWSIQGIYTPDPSTLSPDGFIFFNSIAEPSPMSSAAFGNDRVLTIHRNAAIYVDNGGSFVSWNGSAWVAGSSATFSYLVGKVVFRNYDDSSVMKWQLLIYDRAGVLQDTTPGVAWTATRAPAGGKALWVWFGTARNNAALPSVAAYGFQEWSEPDHINFLTSAQSCELDVMTFDEPFNSEDITVLLARTPLAATEVKMYVKEDAGAFGAAHNVDVTPIAGETGWFAMAAGTTYSSHSTVTLKPESNSPDTDTQIRVLAVKIKGITVAGGGGTRSRMAQPLGIKRRVGA